jgi:hypothetical protein
MHNILIGNPEGKGYFRDPTPNLSIINKPIIPFNIFKFTIW